MENKKKLSNLLIKKSQERLVKALDKLESIVTEKINLAKSSQTVEIIGLRDEVEQLRLHNRELSFALDKLTSSAEQENERVDCAVVELDETIENIERILKIQDADN